ncbi:unnamed protein product [Protopolystoma xenopodis]|uniref:Uncharacterized protein n=1 Tax=Protopolystoma xenopodis TaxID=117903 RepID=A0A3S4ZMI0_9PLAT|nr:unnamed protein product [Protopolystoma xenopodis]
MSTVVSSAGMHFLRSSPVQATSLFRRDSKRQSHLGSRGSESGTTAPVHRASPLALFTPRTIQGVGFSGPCGTPDFVPASQFLTSAAVATLVRNSSSGHLVGTETGQAEVLCRRQASMRDECRGTRLGREVDLAQGELGRSPACACVGGNGSGSSGCHSLGSISSAGAGPPLGASPPESGPQSPRSRCPIHEGVQFTPPRQAPAVLASHPLGQAALGHPGDKVGSGVGGDAVKEDTSASCDVEVTLTRGENGFGFRLVGGAEEGTQVTTKYSCFGDFCVLATVGLGYRDKFIKENRKKSCA